MSETVRTVLSEATRKLAAVGIEGAARDARRLIAVALDIVPGNVTPRLEEPMMPGASRRFEAMIERRLERVPVSHIVSYREFYGRAFYVNEDVLDPRPETETLIEIALAEPFERILDLGTGSGVIALTLVAEREGATAVATDISEDALEVARDNPLLEDFSDRVEFLRSDWFEAVEGLFDLIVSNPPYITLGEMSGLAPEVRDHEPHIALTDGGDGLDAYRAIAARAVEFLTPGGRLLLEIGPTQASAVSDMLLSAGLTAVSVHQDLDGRDRVVEAFAPS